jgi:hypothetical protein
MISQEHAEPISPTGLHRGRGTGDGAVEEAAVIGLAAWTAARGPRGVTPERAERPA